MCPLRCPPLNSWVCGPGGAKCSPLHHPTTALVGSIRLVIHGTSNREPDMWLCLALFRGVCYLKDLVQGTALCREVGDAKTKTASHRPAMSLCVSIGLYYLPPPIAVCELTGQRFPPKKKVLGCAMS